MGTCNTPPANPGSNPMFNFCGYDIRVILINSLPWFVVMDIARALGMDLNQTSSYTRSLAADEKGSIPRSNITLGKVGRGAAYCSIISESGLYKMVLRSDRPNATIFQDWVTRDVLPALRQDGMYVMGEEKVKTGEMSKEELIRLGYEALMEKSERLEVECKHQRQIIDDHLVSLTMDAWCALNSHYLTQSERGKMAWTLRRMRESEGMELPKESRKLTLPGGRVKTTYIFIYPKDMIDTAAKALSIPINMKFDLVSKEN